MGSSQGCACPLVAADATNPMVPPLLKSAGGKTNSSYRLGCRRQISSFGAFTAARRAQVHTGWAISRSRAESPNDEELDFGPQGCATILQAFTVCSGLRKTTSLPTGGRWQGARFYRESSKAFSILIREAWTWESWHGLVLGIPNEMGPCFLPRPFISLPNHTPTHP